MKHESEIVKINGIERHKTKWTYVSEGGGVLYFSFKEEAVSHALQYGGLGIYPPIYGYYNV